MECDDAAVAGVGLYVSYHIVGSEQFGVVACDKVPHDDGIFSFQPEILR